MLRRAGEPEKKLALYEPKKYVELIGGRTAAELGGIPILRMREFGKSGKLPESLVDDIVTRAPQGS